MNGKCIVIIKMFDDKTKEVQVLLELKGLEEVNKYSLPPSLEVVKFISVERMDSDSLFLLLAVFSGFNCLLSALISSKRKAKDYFPGPALASK
jgi:hypothetical protein